MLDIWMLHATVQAGSFRTSNDGFGSALNPASGFLGG